LGTFKRLFLVLIADRESLSTLWRKVPRLLDRGRGSEALSLRCQHDENGGALSRHVQLEMGKNE
jgi:hypothetical protein